MASITDLDPFLQSGSPIADTRVEPEVSRLLAEGGIGAYWRAALELAAHHDTGVSTVNDAEIFNEADSKRIVHFRGKYPRALDPKTGHEVAWEVEILMDKLPHKDIARYELSIPVYSDTFDIMKSQLSIMALDTAEAPTVPGTIAIVEFAGANIAPNHASLAHPKIHWKKQNSMKDAKLDTHEYEIVTNVSDVTVNRLLSAVLRTITSNQ